MKNGDLETKGILSKLVRPEGTLESFKVIFFMVLEIVSPLILAITLRWVIF